MELERAEDGHAVSVLLLVTNKSTVEGDTIRLEKD